MRNRPSPEEARRLVQKAIKDGRIKVVSGSEIDPPATAPANYKGKKPFDFRQPRVLIPKPQHHKQNRK